MRRRCHGLWRLLAVGAVLSVDRTPPHKHRAVARSFVCPPLWPNSYTEVEGRTTKFRLIAAVDWQYWNRHESDQGVSSTY